MKEKSDDMIPGESGEKLPWPLDSHLRELMPEKDLENFRNQLPDAFLSDASEGLTQIEDNKQLESILQHLNQQMHRQLSLKKTHRRRKSISDLSWTYWAIIIIFLLTIVGFIVIRMFLNR